MRIGVVILIASFSIHAAAQTGAPLETSWMTVDGAVYGRIYKTQSAALAGNSSTTWVPTGRVTGGGQTNPAYAGIQSIRVATNFVYVQSSAFAYHTMGPWYFDAAKTDPFVNWPSKRNMLARFPRTPTNTASHTRTSLGAIALWVDGTIIHNQLDAFYWGVTNDVNTGSVFMQSWQRNARYAEWLTFDPDGAHQPYTGEHHHHINPFGLRYELGDHVDYAPATHIYSESTNAPAHSPILGWAFDGYPIYGPYGYSNPNDANSAISRMRSGYVFRDGNYGTSNLTVTGRTTYPAWALAIGKPTTNNGPNVSANYPLGWYVQDFDHLGDHAGYVQGVNYDLDRYNGRSCKTPEFPNGTYAYFVAIETNGVPAFPYIIGLQYYGTKTGGDYGNPASVGFSNVESPAVTIYLGNTNAALTAHMPAYDGTITLTWDSVEGGHYTIETNANLTGWTPAVTNIVATGNETQRTAPATGSQMFYRIKLESFGLFDPVITP